MAITLGKMNQLDIKFKNLVIKAVETSKSPRGTKMVEVMAIEYQSKGLRDKLSQGLKEVNALWDERKDRPAGYIVAASIDRGDGVTISVMVTEEWFEENRKKFDAKKAEWAANL
ncbi:hypothetical protein DFQ01_103214 [Paenibacillus cellulosilyticus]|uniref:Uncharacterized protein n=1 Tax=Paenibacillus cellulosilyticus TaxID=375489 RepID=A0A2V2YX38_9BACL|nr:hypothetical protein [Paenibacillus cellulosilyticus]PWW06312.1 hypothetical protein DFQ01_103214 [Paenibacillus cellulosilyticus]QKS42944.1 hypothetical protein HUB94_00130 [Paenibacillus cellulosilyticus]QKS43467.1 hypothetical protein HUB94_02795 [Paenibacillus cellulosilyticus]QKS46328.1 hypothetical protein HUB94_19160 [Paenibacillus cellulosilyticus]